MTADRHRAEEAVNRSSGAFATTHWSVVLAAGHQELPHATQALGMLCSTYWYPLYACVRRLGHSPEDAQDLTQEFFARLLAKDYVARADPQRGKFRSFLLTALKHFLCDEWDKGRRLKRGGGQKAVSFDAHSAEERYSLEPVDRMTPDRLFDRSWVDTLLQRAVNRLQEEYAASGRAELYDELTGFRLDASEQPSYADVAARVNMSQAAVKSAIHRLRRRHHQLVREEIAQTVSDPSEVEQEIRYLLELVAD